MREMGNGEEVEKAAHYPLVQGLVYLHVSNIVHRDLKAANILLTDQGVVKIGAGVLCWPFIRSLHTLCRGFRHL